MKTFGRGITKFFVANLAVVGLIALLPVFLLTTDFQIYTSLLNYLFESDSIG